MRGTLKILLPILVCLLPHIGYSQVVGFKDWKATRVEEAQKALEKIRLEVQAEAAGRALLSSPGTVHRSPPTAVGRTGQVESLSAPGVSKSQSQLNRPARSEQRQAQAELNVEIAKELSVNDYFVLYLAQFKSLGAFLEAAKKMSPEEVAELMVSYKRHLNSNSGDTEPSSVTAEMRLRSSEKATKLGL